MCRSCPLSFIYYFLFYCVIYCVHTTVQWLQTKETNATGILEEEEGSNNSAVSVTTTLHHFLGTAVIVMKLI